MQTLMCSAVQLNVVQHSHVQFCAVQLVQLFPCSALMHTFMFRVHCRIFAELKMLAAVGAVQCWWCSWCITVLLYTLWCTLVQCNAVWCIWDGWVLRAAWPTVSSFKGAATHRSRALNISIEYFWHDFGLFFKKKFYCLIWTFVGLSFQFPVAWALYLYLYLYLGVAWSVFFGSEAPSWAQRSKDKWDRSTFLTMRSGYTHVTHLLKEEKIKRKKKFKG